MLASEGKSAEEVEEHLRQIGFSEGQSRETRQIAQSLIRTYGAHAFSSAVVAAKAGSKTSYTSGLTEMLIESIDSTHSETEAIEAMAEGLQAANGAGMIHLSGGSFGEKIGYAQSIKNGGIEVGYRDEVRGEYRVLVPTGQVDSKGRPTGFHTYAAQVGDDGKPLTGSDGKPLKGERIFDISDVGSTIDRKQAIKSMDTATYQDAARAHATSVLNLTKEVSDEMGDQASIMSDPKVSMTERQSAAKSYGMLEAIMDRFKDQVGQSNSAEAGRIATQAVNAVKGKKPDKLPEQIAAKLKEGYDVIPPTFNMSTSNMTPEQRLMMEEARKAAESGS